MKKFLRLAAPAAAITAILALLAASRKKKRHVYPHTTEIPVS